MAPEDSTPGDDAGTEAVGPGSETNSSAVAGDDDRSGADAEADLSPDDPRPDDPAEGLEPAVPDPAADVGPGAADLPDPSEVDPDLRRQFWSLVLLFNVALFGMSLGAMLVGFEGRWRIGGAVFAAGAVAFARGWRGYRRATADADE